ncbi:unnamed protein product [Symbiodinium sp. CCMP2592]|nr:unnamed protein product [Symbiodinium sp. CCMP2592]
MAHASFPPEVVDIIGGYLLGLIIRPFGEDEVVTPHYNPAYCLLQRNFLGALLRLRAVQRALVQAPAVQAPAEPLPNPIQVFPLDLDMSFCKVPTNQLPEHPLLDYQLLQQPILKIYPERPQDVIQVCPYPMAVYVPVPAGEDMQDWKEYLCEVLWRAGSEQPVATPTDHSGLTRGAIKVQSEMFKAVLQSAGIAQVYVGRFGMKQLLLPSPQQVLNQIPHVPDAHTAMDIGLMARDENHVWLFGIRCSGHGVWHDRRNGFKWRVLPLVPGSQRNLGGFIYGSLEGKPHGSGPFGNDEGKAIQLYPLLHHTRLALTGLDPVWPSHMYHMINRKQALQDYTFQLLGRLHQATGGRFETRVRASAAQSLAELLPGAMLNLDYVKKLMETGLIQIKRISLQEFKAHVLAAWAWAEAGDCFGGMAAQGPDTNDPGQVALFKGKRVIYLNLLATLGFASGKWNTTLQEHISEPFVGAQADVHWIPAPHAAPARVPAARAMAAPALGPARPADIFLGGEELEDPARQRALRLISRAPAQPLQPAPPYEAPTPQEVSGITVADLCPEELIIESLLPDLKTRGKAGERGSGKPKFAYIGGWGPQDKATRISKGYDSRASMARAIWTWSSINWLGGGPRRAPGPEGDWLKLLSYWSMAPSSCSPGLEDEWKDLVASIQEAKTTWEEEEKEKRDRDRAEKASAGYRPIAANELVVVEAMAHASFPPEVVDIIGGYLLGLIIRPFGEDEVVTPHYNPAYCLLQRNFLGALLRLRAVQRALVQAPAVQAPAEPLPNPIQVFPLDLDMSFCKVPTNQLPEHPLLDYQLLQQPILKIYPERPQDVIQVCPYPMAVYVPVPAGEDMQDWKEYLYEVLWRAGSEQPVATPTDHSGLTRGAIKVQSEMFKAVLQSAGIAQVYVGRFGMKQLLLPSPQQVLNQIPHVPDAHTAMDIGLMARDENHVWLFGIRCSGHGVWHDRRNGFKWRVLPLVPGSQRNLGGFIYGSLEGKPHGSGPFGNDEGKAIQLYPLLHHTRLALTGLDPVWPSHMYHMINRKQALQDYTFQLLGRLHQATGGRFETRVRASAAQSLAELLPGAMLNLDYVKKLMETGLIQIKRISLQEFKAHVLAAWAWAEAGDCFGGMAAQGPDTNDPGQVALFKGKRVIYLNLLATLGFASGKWNTTLQEHISEPFVGAQADVHWIPAPHAAPARVPAARAMAAPALGPARPADIFLGGEELEDPARQRALRLISRAPAQPLQPAPPYEAPTPQEVSGITVADLCPEELIIESLLPDLKTRGKAGERGSGKPKFAYIGGWGPQDKATRISKGYDSRASMARAIWTWSSINWCHRVKYSLPS